MQCRKCGTEISEKALICFKCGTATTEAVHRPFVIQERLSVSFWVSIAALSVLELVGIYAGMAGSTSATRTLGWVIFGVATVSVLVRFLLRLR